MSESAAPPERTSTRKLHKWSGKLFSGENRRGKSEENQTNNEDEVAQFLGGSTSKASSPPPVGTPRLDVRSNAQQTGLAAIESDLGPIQDRYWRPRPALRKGLTVHFGDVPPVIIGEGGDDAELPTLNILEALRAMQMRELSAPTSSKQGPAGPREAVPSALAHQQAMDFKISASDPTNPAVRSKAATDSGLSSRPHPQTATDLSAHSVAVESAPAGLRPPSNDRNAHLHQPDTVRQRKSPSPDVIDPRGNSLTPSPSPRPVQRRPSPQEVSNRAHEHGTSNMPHGAEVRRKPTASPEGARGPQVPDQSSHKSSSRFAHLRKAAHELGDNALGEFDSNVSGMGNIFRMGITAQRDVMGFSFSTWIRAAAWWFLRGRMELENAVRQATGKTSSLEDEKYVGAGRRLMQAHIDLAKCWWIIKEVTPRHPDILKYGNASMTSMVAIVENFGDQELAELIEVHLAILANLRALTISMKRNNHLPPQPFEAQGLDAHVMTDYPNLPRYVAHLDHENAKGSQAGFRLPINDTKHHAALGRMFVKCSLVSEHSGKEEARMPCLITVVQNKSDGGLQAFIASQDGQVGVTIHSDEKKRPNLRWKDVEWIKPSNSFNLASSRDFRLHIVLAEKDFQAISDLYESHASAQRSFAPQRSESIAFECTLRQFERLETRNDPRGFPQGTLQSCHMRLFSRGSGEAATAVHDGFRLTILSPAQLKMVRSLTVDLGGREPILMAPWRPDDRLNMTVRPPGSPQLLLGFHSPAELEAFRATVADTAMADKRQHMMSTHLQGLDIELLQAEDSPVGPRLTGLKWRQLQVMSDTVHASGAATIRMIATGDFGTLVDQINPRPGTVRIALDVENKNVVRLLREPQTDSTCALEENVPTDVLAKVQSVLKQAAVSQTIRTFTFTSISDAHQFESLCTGFSILHDCNVSSLSITRRRMVVPLHKKLEATKVRLQILQRDRYVQFAAYFGDFALGTCLNFELKATDVFETSTRSNSFSLRIVDAKFPFPKSGDDPTKDFLCLDVPEFPGEHDDITISFDTEEARDLFGSFLPATVGKASRLASLRR